MIGFLSKAKRISKIDVEGTDGDVLWGARDLLHSDRPPRILMETHGDEVAMDVNAQLKEAGYCFYTVEGEPLSDGLAERHYLACPGKGNESNSQVMALS